ncbi:MULTISPECIES: ROK family transcriptional regulator [Amycolatopsis]|uniref:Sugar kinase of the NBD/HSP70 family, may contain an N-terminal HTH domain n=2 Tax=Amycolatopsis TaxID=1813 RepID=A0A1I3P2L8_9PSEU|nr:ROK family transcriptional regulator [Amycolatopsis sacchari]SFJ15669.1 Sugar kinase of the NBD/HSP70 family, may contain an N-terminal HTH domain [Amycolatopsis sacchari]
MRELNQRAVLQRLRDHGPATRPRIAADTGLSKPTVGQALLDLEQHGLVRTAGRTISGPGRSAVVYEVNPAAGHVLGIDIGRGLIRVAVADLAGSVVARLDTRNKARSAGALLQSVRSAAEDAVAEAGLRMADIVSTVVGTPGVPDHRSATLRRAPNLPGWERKGLLNELSSLLGTDLVVENDANLTAIGEYEAGAARDADVFVCVTVGTGIGMGIVVDGVLFRGAHGAAGEVGYLPYGWPPPSSPPREGLLESAAAAHSVVEMASARGLSVRTAKDVFTLAREGDARALEAVEEEATRLAFMVASVAAVIDPALVVLGGGIGKNTDLLSAPLERALAHATPLRPTIVPGELGEEAALTGAIATALRTARDVVFERRGQAL